MFSDNELIKVRGTLGIIDNFDNRPYLYIEKYYTQYIPKGPVLLDFENIHRTRKDIGEPFFSLINIREYIYTKNMHETEL